MTLRNLVACAGTVSLFTLAASSVCAQPAPDVAAASGARAGPEIASGGGPGTGMGSEVGSSAAPVGSVVAVPAPGQTVRLGGNKEVVSERKGANWVSGTAAITTPLPEGYPAPTPPGAIDLKTYPSLRRAEFRAETNNSDIGMNVAFFPLFNHIKRRDIAMTSPVEMDYSGLSVTGKPLPGKGADGKDAGGEPGKEYKAPAAAEKTDEKTVVDSGGKNNDGKAATKPAPLKAMTMSFLYRTPELGPVGDDAKDEKVKVVDTVPATYLSVGMQGGYGLKRVRMGMEQLQAFLDANPQWETAGDVRALHYNGPEARDRNKWLEVQVPVKARAAEVKEQK